MNDPGQVTHVTHKRGFQPCLAPFLFTFGFSNENTLFQIELGLAPHTLCFMKHEQLESYK